MGSHNQEPVRRGSIVDSRNKPSIAQEVSHTLHRIHHGDNLLSATLRSSRRRGEETQKTRSGLDQFEAEIHAIGQQKNYREHALAKSPHSFASIIRHTEPDTRVPQKQSYYDHLGSSSIPQLAYVTLVRYIFRWIPKYALGSLSAGGTEIVDRVAVFPRRFLSRPSGKTSKQGLLKDQGKWHEQIVIRGVSTMPKWR